MFLIVGLRTYRGVPLGNSAGQHLDTVIYVVVEV